MQKVDAAFYRAQDAPTGKPYWADQILPVEFKSDDVSFDPFDDNQVNTSTDTITRKKVRGQIISYAELIYAVQQRVALFMLVVIGPNVRFIRWDRSGALVTRPLNYVENWKRFCNILWRIGQCSDADLGLDPTATRLYPQDPDYIRMTAATLSVRTDVRETERDLQPGDLPEEGPIVFEYVRAMFKQAVNSPWPRYRLKVPYGTSTRTFLVAKPTFRARGLAGRGTRGYVALDCATEEFVWLKDAWRAHYLLIDKEGDVLKRLNEAGVENVPTLICHGDIAGQETLTPKWWKAKNPLNTRTTSTQSAMRDSSPSPCSPAPSSSGALKRKRDDERSEDSVPLRKGANTGTGFSAFREECPLRLHQHYRLVEKEVGMPLANFKNGRQLVAVVLKGLNGKYFHLLAELLWLISRLQRIFKRRRGLLFRYSIATSAEGTSSFFLVSSQTTKVPSLNGPVSWWTGRCRSRSPGHRHPHVNLSVL